MGYKIGISRNNMYLVYIYIHIYIKYSVIRSGWTF